MSQCSLYQYNEPVMKNKFLHDLYEYFHNKLSKIL